MSSVLFLDYIRCNELSILDYEDILEEIAEYKDNISKIPNFTKLFWFLKSIKYSSSPTPDPRSSSRSTREVPTRHPASTRAVDRKSVV